MKSSVEKTLQRNYELIGRGPEGNGKREKVLVFLLVCVLPLDRHLDMVTGGFSVAYLYIYISSYISFIVLTLK